jgi:hypothetical protein
LITWSRDLQFAPPSIPPGTGGVVPACHNCALK